MMRFIATCAAGLESLVREELSGWVDGQITVSSGAVYWSGSLQSGYRACLWSRFASRILLEIGEMEVSGPDDLYEQVGLIDWDIHLDEKRTFAVDCTRSADAPPGHSKYWALRVKDSLVDYFRERTGGRPSVELKRPDVRLNVHIGAKNATLAVDLSGDSLHRRGYRTDAGIAPLKESLAAAIIKLSGWGGEDVLLDPLCGSGTLLIEAALMFSDCAPGLGRTYFGLTGWRGHDEAVWANLVQEAIDREDLGQRRPWPPLIGFEADRQAVAAARKNVRQAGLENRIRIEHRELAALRSEYSSGHLVCNPPYGERLSEKETIKYLYRFLGHRLPESFNGWHLGLFTSASEHADLLGIDWQSSHQLFNGALPCRLYLGIVGSPSSPFIWPINIPDPQMQGVDFANRLRKNLKQRLSWAQREGLTNLRVYDRDLPDYNVRIELFRKWVFIQEYPASKKVDQEAARARFKTVLESVRCVLGAGRDRVFLQGGPKRELKEKARALRQKKRENLYETQEGSAHILVAFSSDECFGLMLDQQLIRARVGAEAKDLAILNCFDQAGSATIHAALGGARKTTTIVPDEDHRRRVELNFILNGMHPDRHRIVVGSCLECLADEKSQYDLIYANPRRKVGKKGGNAQRFCNELLEAALRRLAPSGFMVYSTDHHDATLSRSLQERYSCRDIGKAMLPADCRDRAEQFQCWEIRHPGK